MSRGLTRNRQSSLVLYLSMFIMGGAGLAYEYSLSKLSADLLGNSVHQWAIIIGVMMFFMGVGADAQKHVGPKFLIEKFVIAELLLAVVGGFAPLVLLYTYGNLFTHFVLVQYAIIGFIGLLIGFEIPLLTRINCEFSKSLSINLGGILKMDYMGSLCGAVVWVFVLPKYFSYVEISLVLGLFTVAAALIAYGFFRNQIQARKTIAVSIAIVSTALAIGYSMAGDLESYSQQFLYRDRIIASKNSPYQHIVLTESPNEHISLYINGHLQFSSADEAIYHEQLVQPAMSIARGRRNVLILGGGDGLALREVLKHKDVEAVTLVDLDPMITNLASSHPKILELNDHSFSDARVRKQVNTALLPGSQMDVTVANQNRKFLQSREKVATVEVFNIDAAKFVEQVLGTYDVIILDFPDPNSPDLAKLYSKSLYRNLRRRLSPGGVIVQQSTSPYFAKEAFLMIGRTMRAAGLATVPYHQYVPSFGDWGWWIATDSSFVKEAVLKKRMVDIQDFVVKTQFLTPDLTRASLVFGREQLKSSEQRINTIATSLITRKYLQGWESML